MNQRFLFILTTLLVAFTVHAQQTVTVQDEQTGTEEVITLPESMTFELDSLLQEWHCKNYLCVDTACENSEKNPQYTKEEYIARLNRLPNVIEMPYNDVVRRFIDQYCEKRRSSVSVMLGAFNFYAPIFEEALESYQLPLELKYLPIIESALKPTATSRAGAAGLWQFMLKTGKIYGLEVNSLVDERRDPIKSSYAAARYLKELHDIYGDWTLVIAAYNCGPGNVNKAIRRSGGSKDYWKIYPFLPSETRGYVPAFIAANYAMNFYCEHNICPANAVLPISTDTLMLHRDVHFEQIVAMCNVKMAEVEALNPQYRKKMIPGSKKPSVLRLPTHSISAFINAGDSVYKYKSDELFTNRKEVAIAASSSGGATYITIRNGDSLSTIARRHGTTVSRLKQLNGLRNNNIRAGRRLRVR